MPKLQPNLYFRQQKVRKAAVQACALASPEFSFPHENVAHANLIPTGKLYVETSMDSEK